MRCTYKSVALEALHETVSSLYTIGLMSEDEMCFYDEGCLANSAPRGERASGEKGADAAYSANTGPSSIAKPPKMPTGARSSAP